ncbi:MAG: 5,10-methylenetetrahydromethanopterin reductase [Chloroflexota bacterium]|nr:5,10-methylenetetrahydromethanopterin reductase [Chloroflexota bacterium]
MPPRFGVSFLPRSADRVSGWARLAEELGFARVGIGDSPALYRDPWMTLALVARATERIPIGIWVTNPATRHPVVTASAAAMLDELAPGRVCIGIATGDSGVSGAGLRPGGVDGLAAYVRAVRALLENGEASYEGATARLSWPERSRQVPIYVAAHGQRSMQLAGEIADGAIMGLGILPAIIDQSLEWLRQGAVRAGRRHDDIDVWWTVRYLVDERADVARTEMAGILAEAAHMLARTAFKAMPGGSEHQAGLERLASEYDPVMYGRSEPDVRRRHARRAAELGVADYLLDRYAFAGTPEECASQVERATRAGATQFMYSMRGPDRESRLRDWHRLVMTRASGESQADPPVGERSSGARGVSGSG